MRVIFSGERFSHYDFCNLLRVYKPSSRHEGGGGGKSYNLLGICLVVMVRGVLRVLASIFNKYLSF